MAADKSPDTTPEPTKDVADVTPKAMVTDTTAGPSKDVADATPKVVAAGEEEESDPNNPNRSAGEDIDQKNPVSTKENVSSKKSVEGSSGSRDTKASTSSVTCIGCCTNSITEEAFSEDAVPKSIDEKKPTPLDVSSPTGASKSEYFKEDGSVAISPPPISPASTQNSYVTHNTYNTYKTYSTTDSPNETPNQKIEIINRPKKSKTKSVSAGATALLCGMRKPALCVCIILLVIFACTNFFGWFRVPGLDNQIERLEVEINDLEDQVGRLAISVQELSVLNEDYAQLNRELEDEVEDLEQIDGELKGEVEEISSINQNLTATNLEISETIVQLNYSTNELQLVQENLTATNDELKDINKALEESVNQLENSTNELASIEIQLREDITTLEEISGNLTYEVSDLEIVTKGLNESVTLYEGLNSNLTHEEEMLRWGVGNLTKEVNSTSITVTTLEKLEDDLKHIVEQLNVDSAELNATFNQVQISIDEVNQESDRLEKLNSDINIYIDFYGESDNYTTLNGIINYMENDNENRENNLANTREVLRSKYEDLFYLRFDNWDCAFEYEFAGYDWAGSNNINITQLDLVIEYVEKRVLDPLCMDTENFKAFLASENITNITLEQLQKVVDDYRYVSGEYYYPGDDAPPTSVTTEDWIKANVTTEDWIKANFSCENLANQYRWVDQST